MRNPVVYLAVLCAGVADIYIVWLSSRTTARYEPEDRRPRKSFPWVLLVVGLIPIVISIPLAFLGFLGPPVRAALNVVIVDGFSITFFFISFSIPLSLKYAHMEKSRVFDESYNPLVTILVPAYNEEKVLSRSLETLVNLKYQKKEIIVIDDGSTDKTNLIASWYKQYGVKVLKKPNGGKSRALNYGLLFSRGEIVVTVDADGMLPRDAIDEIVRILSNRNVQAVSGNVKALNAKNTLMRCQQLEYITAINTLRNALDLFGAVIVVPGAFGAFRREAVVNTGHYDSDTITEDFDLTLKIQKAYGSIAASTSAIAYTEVPDTLSGLYRQRMRWVEGTYQTVAKHRDTFWNARYGNLHRVIFPLLILSFVVPFATMTAWTAAILLAVSGSLLSVLEMLVLFMLIQFFVALVALSLDNTSFSLAPYSFLLVIGYRQFLDCVSILAFTHFLVKGRKRNIEWKRVERVGGIQPAVKS
jgi:peptidoglycan-N-acetylglucosamine deacetylase